MSLSEKKYKITGWHGEAQLLTAKNLYERVLEDSKSDYNWIASAAELVKVCNEPDFPKMYATNIKIIILNCFANLELQQERCYNCRRIDEEAVYSCYNSLSETDAAVIKVKEKYLAAIIEGITRYSGDEERFPIHFGPAYKKTCEDWKKAKFHEYVSETKIDFNQLREKLNTDFEKTIKKAEENGTFDEDDKLDGEQLQWHISPSINLKELYSFSNI